MKRTRRLAAALAFAGILVAGASVTIVACSNQGEGDRCDTAGPNGGNDDCQSGLVCTSKSTLNSNADLCCPPDRTQATTNECAISKPPIGEAGIPDTGTPADSGGGDSAPSEAGPDSAPDAPSEASTDAGSDAPSDAPDGG